MAGRVEDASRPEQGSRALLMLDGLASSAVRPGTLYLELGVAAKLTAAPGTSSDGWKARLKDRSIAGWRSS